MAQLIQYQPPPTWANPILIEKDAATGETKSTFNPVWLKWFVDLTALLTASGGGSGVISGGTSTTTTISSTGAFMTMLGNDSSGDEGIIVPGPMGPTGNPGVVGPQGAPGAAIVIYDGDDGIDAIPIQGQQGVQGATGVQGAAGAYIFLLDGDDGIDAIPVPGVQGPQGNQGIQGLPGFSIFREQGDDGVDAIPIPGVQGPQGNPGIPGVPGTNVFVLDGDDGIDAIPIPGVPGPIGTAGTKWFTSGINPNGIITGSLNDLCLLLTTGDIFTCNGGTIWVDSGFSIMGPVGLQGRVGEDGEDGLPVPGVPGPQGNPGAAGSTGAVGPMGPTLVPSTADWDDGPPPLYYPLSEYTSPSWTPYTPTITAQTGTFTTVSASARYKRLGNIVFFNCTVVVTTVGTAATAMVFTVPFTPDTSLGTPTVCGVGANTTSGAERYITFFATNRFYTVKYDGTFGVVSGDNIVLTFFYEAV